MVQTRVIVYLNQTPDAADAATDVKKNNFQYGGEVSVLDDKTLRLLCCQSASKPHVLVAQKLRFDVLSTHQNEQQKERELNTLLHTLFVDKRDCLLFHLSAEPGYNLMFLVDALIVQVNVKLQQESLQLEGCSVHYKHLTEGLSDTVLDTQSNFCDAKHLMNWLLSEYRMRTTLATGHEALEVQYVLTHREHARSSFSVKFHILLVAMQELCLGTLCGLRCYFSNDPLTAALSVTELTTYIRDAIEANTSNDRLYMLMLCHVLATGSQVNSKNVQLLSLAHLACAEGDSRQEKFEVVRGTPRKDAALRVMNLELYAQQLSDSFQLLHDQLLTYVGQEQQLRQTHTQILKEREEFVATLLASQAKLVQLKNLMLKSMHS